MKFNAIIVCVAASLASGATIPEPTFTITESVVTPASPLSARSGDSVHCYSGGAWMKQTTLHSAAQQWCDQNDGQNVAKGFNFASTAIGAPLGNGKPGKINFHYTNDNQVEGWRIDGTECLNWMDQIIQGCAGDNADSNGGHVKTDYGSIWADPNAE